MKQIPEPLSLMPDVHAEPVSSGPLAWVGMEDILMPMRIATGPDSTQQVIGRVDAFVNLVRSDQRGIHMSRLYRLIDQHLGDTTLDAHTLEQLLRAFLQSHEELADRARIRLRFDQALRRKALRSDLHGWRVYPVTIEGTLDERGLDITVATEIAYSSTCPASAALARQVIQQHFEQRFSSQPHVPCNVASAWLGGEQGVPATPHAQRSIAYVWTRLAQGTAWDVAALVDRIEASLGTPVQTIVKRQDEQAFALANGSNLMFCEDAARRIQRALDTDCSIADFHVRIVHQESLHAHNAVAYARKEQEVSLPQRQ
ncbi:GTP cyclohydrolase FolE2 [Dyella sp. AD56]|uniref:GTP cyclohydrolase FolE2 n=1 Tax=Dyella sp. AD56 TaxID=1528744 RepID=UPI000CC04FA7|nr:GTP cyclohydrolase FolE2 [Dyella sp. AD56]PMQ04576.1 GTP cyclohydrolase FolE2 [Dyella sp. AD56]